jgi:hypothetical protein
VQSAFLWSNDCDVLVNSGWQDVAWNLTDSRYRVSCDIEKDIARLDLYVLQFCGVRFVDES